jgi:glycine/D-amino acid oxidase-like deaminating enzyme/nitrite reductase/ring-hydroxylating ferredoxin subunit
MTAETTQASTKALREASTPYWHTTSSPAPHYPALDREVEADVAILGGGITGLTAAMHLSAVGKKVVVLEAGRIGAGTTGGTSGHLDAMPDQGAGKLIADFGESDARAVTRARSGAIDQIEAWCRELDVNCDFHRVPAFTYSETAEGAAALEDECDAARRLGLDVALAAPAGLDFARGGFRIEGQARFHALRYLRGMAEFLHRQGVAIYENSRAAPPKDGQPCELEAGRGRVLAQDVLLCTHSCYLGISPIDLRIAPYQSYVLTARVDTGLPDALYWDDVKPYHYVRQSSSDDPSLLVVGGADHKTGQGGDERVAFQHLEDYTRDRFHTERIEHRWSAELFEPADGLPLIGRAPFSNHLYLGTGYSGTGLTFGVVAGRLMADLVLGRKSAVAEILSPSRIKPMAAAGTFVSENLNVARRYVTDRFRAQSVETFNEVRNGEGRLVRYRGKQWAVYRDDQGTLHVLSPVCTHAGCHVQWNEFEKTWDCPCHGGRFAPSGERIYGPPPADLESKAVDDL